MKELVVIQSMLKAPKGQRNKFGNYNYRSCEDILEALKPLLKQENCFLTISDEIIPVSDTLESEYVVIGKQPTEVKTLRTYVRATATITNAEGVSVSASASARESSHKTGMDSAQLTGATSSYARKYALNGLFCIDDTKDADATNDHGKGNGSPPKKEPPKKPPLDVASLKTPKGLSYIKGFSTAQAAIDKAKTSYSVSDKDAAIITEIWESEAGQ